MKEKNSIYLFDLIADLAIRIFSTIWENSTEGYSLFIKRIKEKKEIDNYM